jgi:hypothetical protein
MGGGGFYLKGAEIVVQNSSSLAYISSYLKKRKFPEKKVF